MFLGRVLPVPCQPSGTPLVAGSRPSKLRLWMTLRAAAASATVRPWGPTVSWVCEMGTTPARLVSPTVGLMPTTPFAFAGQTMLPSVSLPNETVAKFADAEGPEHHAAAAQRIRVAGHHQRVRVELNHRVDPRAALVQREDARDIFPGQLLRRKHAGSHLRLELGNRSFVVLCGNGVLC